MLHHSKLLIALLFAVLLPDQHALEVGLRSAALGAAPPPDAGPAPGPSGAFLPTSLERLDDDDKSATGIDKSREESGLEKILGAGEECPLAKFNMHSNRYEVTPVQHRIRSKLELRRRASSGTPCTGTLVNNRTFGFEAAHYDPHKGVWQGVFAVPSELYDWHRECPLEGGEWFELCLMNNPICLARVEIPPAKSWLERLELVGFVPRERKGQLRSCLNWLCAIMVIYLLLALGVWVSVPYIIDIMGLSDESELKERQHSAGRTDEITIQGIPLPWELMVMSLVSLARFAATALSLVLVICYFMLQRDVQRIHAYILFYGPVVLTILHVFVVFRSLAASLLYNSMLRDRMHIVFNPRPLMIWEPFLVAAGAVAITMLYAGFRTLTRDMLRQECPELFHLKEGIHQIHYCDFTSIGLYSFAKLWGLIFPLGYLLALLCIDEFFEWKLVPLHDIYLNTPNSQELLGETRSVVYRQFVFAAHEKAIADGNSSVTFSWAREWVKENPPEDEGEYLLRHTSMRFFPRVKIMFLGTFSVWSWRMRFRYMQSRAFQLRILIAVAIAAVCWSFCLAIFAEIFRLKLVPTLVEVTPAIGQLSPAFDPYVFNYNLFIDHRVKSTNFEVSADKDTVSTVALHLQGISESETARQPWTSGTKRIQVPLFVQNAFAGANNTQDTAYMASRNSPVVIRLHVLGAGLEFEYRITVVKTETRISSLEYRYNTSRSVNEVVVKKKIDWESVSGVEESDEEKEEFGDDFESAAVYVPIDTKNVSVSMERSLAIYGPAGNTVVSGAEVDEFEAERKVLLCASGDKNCKEKRGVKTVEVQNDVTAVPIVLKPAGSDPFRFSVNIIRVANRLVNLDIEQPGTGKPTKGWGAMPLLPPFRPFTESFESFFEVPYYGDDHQDDSYQTLFLRVVPQGNSRTNWVEAEVVPNDNSEVELELFCSPHQDDDEDLLDPSVASITSDLECGATDAQTRDPESGKPTEDIIIRDKTSGRGFRKHFFIRYKYKVADIAPFTLFLRVAYLEHATELAEVGHRVYEVKFLPQVPMRLELSAPRASPGSVMLQSDIGKGISRKTFDLPLFLSPEFRSDILQYTAVVPRDVDDAVMVHLMQKHSLWASSGSAPLQGLGRGAELRQEVKLQHGPDCIEEEISPTLQPHKFQVDSAPSPAAVPPSIAAEPAPTLLQTSNEICPVRVRIYERMEGFPRTYTVKLHPAKQDDVLLVGMLGSDADIASIKPLSGFQPSVQQIYSSLKDLEWTWGPASSAATPTEAPAPAAAAPASSMEDGDIALITPAAASKAMSTDSALAVAPQKPNLLQVLRLNQSQDDLMPWTGEPLPTGSLSILAASRDAALTVHWNGLPLPLSRSEDLWWQASLSGKALVEACWCDREQVLRSCRRELRAQAPIGVRAFYRPNECELTLKVDEKTAHVIRIGHDLDGVDDGLLEKAADEADEAKPVKVKAAGQSSSLMEVLSRVPRRSSTETELSASPDGEEFLIPQGFVF